MGAGDNLKNVMSNDKSRTVVILSVIAVVATFAIAMIYSSKDKKSVSATASVGGTPELKAVPGTSDSTKFTGLVKESNQQKATEAEKSGGSAIPTITADPGKSSKDPFDLIQKKPDEEAKAAPKPAVTVAPAPAPVAAPVARPRNVENAADEQKLAALMGQIIAGWNPNQQKLETDYTGQGNQRNAQQGAIASAGGSQASSGAAVAAAEPASADVSRAGKKPALIKASSISSAVMITSVDSDEPGPVLAEIVSGPFTGARIMGTFQKGSIYAENLLLQFSTLTLPAKGSSMKINAFAVDPESARTGLKTGVDKHYLERYGSMFASSFLKGYAQALSQSGTTQTTAVGGGGATQQTQFPILSPKEKTLTALGEVGKAAGTMLAPSIARPITIKIESGTAFGVLFMADVTEDTNN